MAAPLDLTDAPKVSLGGKDWAIPELAVKQIMRLIPAMGRLQKIGATGFDALAEEEVARIYDVAFIGLSRAYPDLTRELFDELPIKIHEIMAAIPTIARQAGLEFRDASPMGEA